MQAKHIELSGPNVELVSALLREAGVLDPAALGIFVNAIVANTLKSDRERASWLVAMKSYTPMPTPPTSFDPDV